MELSIIIPSYNEKDNIGKLLKKIFLELKINKIKGEVIVVDDNSPDGTGKLLEKLKSKFPNLEVVHRSKKLGLSSAVIKGFSKAKSSVLCVMDADLSHPPNKIYEMFQLINSKKADIIVGSRYIKEGKSISHPLFRRVISRSLTYLSRTLTKVKDPLSGFFMFKKDCIKNKTLNPKGFKILLDILVKSRCTRVKEIPITFVNRKRGRSKATAHQAYYLFSNLFLYFLQKKSLRKEFFLFQGIGVIGTIINLGILYLLTSFLGIYYMISALIAFVFALTNNFILNKIYTFKEGLTENITKKYIQFFSISVFTLSINLILLFLITEFLNIHYMISQIISLSFTGIINFFGNKVWTFSK